MKPEEKLVIEANNLEEALENASKQWGVPKEELEAEIISTEQKGGFLGLKIFGQKKIKAEIKRIVKNVSLAERSIEFLNKAMELMNFQSEAIIKDGNALEIIGEDSADFVVGHYGDCLKSMEYLVNLALRDPKREPRIRLDSCGYRARRTRSLERLAEATARQAVKYGRPVRLDPMMSWERWVIHTTLKDRDDVTTESIGEPPLRKVVIMPKYDASENSGISSSRFRYPRRSSSNRFGR